MATKTISITEDAYEILKSWKDENESFSQVITKFGAKNNLLKFAGILSAKSKKDLVNSFNEGRRLSRDRAKRQGL